MKNENGISRIMLANKVAEELLFELEIGDSPISNCLMKAKRLARLMRDNDAQNWLDLEMRGYPKNGFNFIQLGSCKQYAIQGGRITEEDKYWLLSFPEIEAYVKASEISLSGLKFPSSVAPSVSSSNPAENTGFGITNAVNAITNGFSRQVEKQNKDFVQYSKLYNGLKSALHNYVTDLHISLTLGNVAENIFEEAREKVDRFISTTCPRAAEQLVAINERMLEGKNESYAEALTTCRRILLTIADAIFPPSSEPYIDCKGKSRKVGGTEYKNRLLAYIDQKLKSESGMDIHTSQIEHLALRLDAVYEKVCKGVHANVSREEASLAIINTYLIIAEIASFQ